MLNLGVLFIPVAILCSKGYLYSSLYLVPRIYKKSLRIFI